MPNFILIWFISYASHLPSNYMNQSKHVKLGICLEFMVMIVKLLLLNLFGFFHLLSALYERWSTLELEVSFYFVYCQYFFLAIVLQLRPAHRFGCIETSNIFRINCSSFFTLAAIGNKIQDTCIKWVLTIISLYYFTLTNKIAFFLAEILNVLLL